MFVLTQRINVMVIIYGTPKVTMDINVLHQRYTRRRDGCSGLVLYCCVITRFIQQQPAKSSIDRCPLNEDIGLIYRVTQIKLNPWNLLPNFGKNFVKS